MFQNLFEWKKRIKAWKYLTPTILFVADGFFFIKRSEYAKTCHNKKIKLLILMSKSNAFFVKWLVIILKYYKAIKLGLSFLFVLMLLNISIQVKSDFFFHDMTYNLPFSKILFSYNNKYQHPRPSWRTFDTHHLTDTTDAFL